jgi:hypothetical protein
MIRLMLGRMRLWVSAGLLLCACGGDGTKSQGAGEPKSCDAGCSAGEVCSDGQCLPGCSRAEPCADEGDACRQGACHPVVCGDEWLEGDEECDNGERNADDASCTTECLDASCGDGFVRKGREECDDGRDNADDGACTTECAEARCGDGLVWAGHEDCDDGAKNADDGACTSECVEARCGDGVVWVGHEDCDDGNENLDDTCPDGPKGTCQWNLPPDAATGLGWQQSSPSNGSTAVAIWTTSPAPNLVSQELQLFSDDNCSQASGAPMVLPSTSSTTLQVPLAGEGSYTFQITTRDSEDREIASACSPVMVIDTTPPQPATALGFVETSPHDTLTVHGTWTRSVSTDIGAQSLQLYGGGNCGVATGSATDVGSATAEQYPLVTPTNATYSFKVITSDEAGNTAVSACSPAIQTSGGQPYTAKFNGDLPQSVVQARIDPKNSATVYVTLTSGEVHKSLNGGSTWAVQCKSTNIASYGGSYGHLVVSPDGSAYATGHTQFARVEALAGAECPVAFHSSAAWASYYHSNRLAIDSTGKLYTWTFTSPGGLLSSTSHGDTYSAINTTPSLFNSMEVDPFDDKHLVAVFGSHSSDPVGIYHSPDAGVTWTQTDVSFEQYQGGVRFNPAAQGFIYLDGGYYSKNGGVSWTTNAAFDCMEIDATGAGYRLVTGVGVTDLQRTADMINPVWSTLHSFSGQANLGVSMVSVVGATIAVVLEGNLHVSKNAGASFTPVKLAVKDGSLIASSIVAHGPLVYAAASGRIFKSTNGAESWSEAYAPTQPLDQQTELHLNPGVVAQLVARPESWNSTYDERVDVTLDGGASWSTSADCCYGWAGVLALGAVDASRILYFGWEPRVSNNGGLSFTESYSSGPLVWDPWPAAFITPGDNNLTWYGDDSGRLYEFSLLAKDETNITSRLPFTDPAGMDLVKVAGVWNLRVISRTGKIAVSRDNGATFALAAGSGGLPSVDRRVFVSHPDTPNLIATAALLGGDVAYSPTLGASWVQTPVANCEIRGLALTDGQLLIPCDGSVAMAIAAP